MQLSLNIRGYDLLVRFRKKDPSPLVIHVGDTIRPEDIVTISQVL